MFRRFSILFFLCLIISFGQAKKTSGLQGTAGRHQAETQKADGDNLSRLKDQAELDRFVAQGLLVRMPENESIEIDKKIPVNRRYCRPWTRDFLLVLSADYKTQFHKKLKVTSGIRTLVDQEELRKHNKNASTTSTHPTGATVDVTWKKMHRQQVAWVAGQLLTLQKAGKIQATQEQKQPCFHVLVLKKYSDAPLKTPDKKSPQKKGGKKK